MHIVVCIKQVPDSAQIRVPPVTNTIMRPHVAVTGEGTPSKALKSLLTVCPARKRTAR